MEADASSITNSFPCPPITPERPKKIPNFSADDSSSPDKNQEYITSTNGANENRCNELLHNLVESSNATLSSPGKGNNIVAKESNEGIDLNKTPKQKQPKKRKHRPKVVVEGKPKKIPKPKAPRNQNPKENPTGKRKYVRKNNSKVPATDPTGVMKEIPDPSLAGSTEKSCKRALNFGDEKSGDGQHEVTSQQVATEPTFTLNLSSKTKETSTGINTISGTKVASLNNQQNGQVAKNHQMSAVESRLISADYTSLLKRYTPAAKPTTKNLPFDNLNAISSSVNKRNADYVPVPQHVHADGIGQFSIQPLTNDQEKLDSSRRQMMHSTYQSLTNKLANPNQAKGSKRNYCNAIEQSQSHSKHLIGPSLCQEIFRVNEYNSSNLSKVLSDRQKKRKTEYGANTNMSFTASFTSAQEGELHQAEAKGLTGCNVKNPSPSQINCGIRNKNPQDLVNKMNNTISDSSIHQIAAGNSMQKQHILNGRPSKTEYVRGKELNGCAQLCNLTALTTAAKAKPQLPVPVKAKSYCSRQNGVESPGAITLVEKPKEPALSNSQLFRTDKPTLQEPKDALYDYHQLSIKKRGNSLVLKVILDSRKVNENYFLMFNCPKKNI